MREGCIFLFYFLFSISLYGQGLQLEDSHNDRISLEIEIIHNRRLPLYLSQSPIPAYKKNVTSINLVKFISSKMVITPVVALRFGQNGFDLHPKGNSKNVFWYTPGLIVDYRMPVANTFSGLWLHAWGRFYKHAALGVDHIETVKDQNIFFLNPDLSFPFYTKAQWSNSGVEFDESTGGIAILNMKNFISFGKMRSRVGPFQSGNLLLSGKSPAFTQVNASYHINKKLSVMWIIGQLESNVVDFWQLEQYTLQGQSIRIPYLKRNIFFHRINYKPVPLLRVSFHELLISGSQPPWSFYNPITFYWSEEHENGDLDNVLIGFDFEWIISPLRIYGAFVVDEWDPLNTFNKDHHNWFGSQAGISWVHNVFGKEVFAKVEYSRLSPQLYSHKFQINIPMHHGYPLGFWSGGHAEEFYLYSLLKMNSNRGFSLEYRHTEIGNNLYELEIPFFPDLWKRNNIIFTYSDLFTAYHLHYEISLGRATYTGKYKLDNGWGCQGKILYNISY